MYIYILCVLCVCVCACLCVFVCVCVYVCITIYGCARVGAWRFRGALGVAICIFGFISSNSRSWRSVYRHQQHTSAYVNFALYAHELTFLAVQPLSTVKYSVHLLYWILVQKHKY